MLVFLKTAYFPACCAVLQVGFQVSQRSVRVCTYDIIYILYKARALVFHRSYFIEVTSHKQYTFINRCLTFVAKELWKKRLRPATDVLQHCDIFFCLWLVLIRILFSYDVENNVSLGVNTDAFHGAFVFFYCHPICGACAFAQKYSLLHETWLRKWMWTFGFIFFVIWARGILIFQVPFLR